MRKISVRPNKFLSKYIDRIYTLEYSNISKEELPLILPGTGLELMFHFNNTFKFNNTKVASAHIICPREIIKLENTNRIHYLSVRFRCGAFSHFSPVPYLELNNTFLSVADLWGRDGLWLQEQLNEPVPFEQKVRHIENFLLTCFQKYSNDKYRFWDQLLNDIYNKNDISLTSFSQQLNIGLRQFERNFKHYYGITPKKFVRIARFQKTIKEIISNQSEENYLPIVLDHGYYDQSHFIKEFNSLVGKAPKEYFKKDIYSVKYFNESSYNWEQQN